MMFTPVAKKAGSQLLCHSLVMRSRIHAEPNDKKHNAPRMLPDTFTNPG